MFPSFSPLLRNIGRKRKLTDSTSSDSFDQHSVGRHFVDVLREQQQLRRCLHGALWRSAKDRRSVDSVPGFSSCRSKVRPSHRQSISISLFFFAFLFRFSSCFLSLFCSKFDRGTLKPRQKIAADNRTFETLVKSKHVNFYEVFFFFYRISFFFFIFLFHSSLFHSSIFHSSACFV